MIPRTSKYHVQYTCQASYYVKLHVTSVASVTSFQHHGSTCEGLSWGASLQAKATLAKEGCSLHSILPRTLEMMSRGKAQNSQDEKVTKIVAIMKSVQLDPDLDGQETGTHGRDWQEILATLEEEEEPSFAATNQKRRNLTFEAFKCPLMIPKTYALSSLMQPNVRQMHVLFKRTQLISKMQSLPLSQSEELAKCREEFFGYALGFVLRSEKSSVLYSQFIVH